MRPGCLAWTFQTPGSVSSRHPGACWGTNPLIQMSHTFPGAHLGPGLAVSVSTVGYLNLLLGLKEGKAAFSGLETMWPPPWRVNPGRGIRAHLARKKYPRLPLCLANLECIGSSTGAGDDQVWLFFLSSFLSRVAQLLKSSPQNLVKPEVGFLASGHKYYHGLQTGNL